jgi:FdhD protein
LISLSVQGVRVNRIGLDGSAEPRDDVVARDVAVCLFVNDEPYRTFIASPGMAEELAWGHIFTEGLISSTDDVEGMTVSPTRVDVTLKNPVDIRAVNMGRSTLLTMACGSSSIIRGEEAKLKKVKGGGKVYPVLIHDIIGALNERSTVFRETGGTHSALLYREGDGVVAFSEDVGRHNALDKVIGAAIIKKMDLGDCILASSGRLSGEMVLKAASAGIPVICSVSAPLLSGIRIAEEAGVTLIGFVRGRRMNQYTRL